MYPSRSEKQSSGQPARWSRDAGPIEIKVSGIRVFQELRPIFHIAANSPPRSARNQSTRTTAARSRFVMRFSGELHQMRAQGCGAPAHR
jgi:hypothetical protein